LNFSAPCRMRGAAALMALPKVELPMFPSTELGPLNCVWLKTLLVPRIKRVQLALVVLAGNSDQKIGKVDARLLSRGPGIPATDAKWNPMQIAAGSLNPT
jgi:hypothetical protein